MGHDPADLPRFRQAGERPRPAAVLRFVHAPPGRRVAANTGGPGADVDHVPVGRGHGDRADGPAEEPVRDVGPVLPAVGGLPHTTAGGAHQERVRAAGNARDRRRAAAPVRADHPVFERPEQAGIEHDVGVVRGLLGDGGGGCTHEGRHDERRRLSPQQNLGSHSTLHERRDGERRQSVTPVLAPPGHGNPDHGRRRAIRTVATGHVTSVTVRDEEGTDLALEPASLMLGSGAGRLGPGETPEP